MRRAFALPFVLATLALGFSPARADDDPLAGVSGERALEFARELSADPMKGRRTGSEGGDLAEVWVQGKMGEIGLDPMDGPGAYLVAFKFPTKEVVAPIALVVGGEAAEYRKDYLDLLLTGDGTVEAEVVFVGYGIAAKERGWDDYEGVDVKGKVVLAIRGAPAAREGDFQEEKQIGWKASCAADHGAAAFLLADQGGPTAGATIQPKFHRPGLPALFLSPAMADKILAKQKRTIESLRATRDAGDPGRSFGTGVTVKVEVHGRYQAEAVGRNCVGGIKGRDRDLVGEVVLVGAHMDHIGTDPAGKIYPGADDNASGTATLLALAETLKKNRWRPRRTVVFCAFAGEDQGLVGSDHFVRDVPFENKAIVAMLNMDMTGQGKPEVNLGGGERYPALWDRAMAALPAAWKDKVHPFRAERNSDHWPFFERGIPALFAVTAGDHANYHGLGDVAANLKPECMEAAARIVGSIVVALGDAEEPLATGKDLPGYLLREGARVVDGAAPLARVRALLAAPAAPLGNAGGVCFVLPVDEAQGGAAVAWARAVSGARARPKEVTLAKSGADISNAARLGRVVVLPRLLCAASAKALPGVLSTYRDLGARWVAPFAAGAAPAAAERDAILDAAKAAHLVVDLTGLSKDALPAARSRLGGQPATYSYAPPAATEVPAAFAEAESLRAALGAGSLLLVSGPAAAAYLSAEALAAPADAAKADVAVVDDDEGRLVDALAAAKAAGAEIDDPEGPTRARVRSLLGQAFVALFRRLP